MIINFLGDSITEGACASSEQNTYVYKVGALLNAKVNNYGISGARIARQQHPSVEARFDLDYCQRASQMEKDADIVFVFGGTNDYGHGDAPIGEPSDRTPNTFYGAMHYLINELLKYYDREKIVFILPLYRLDEWNPYGDGSKQVESLPLEGYRQIMIDVCHAFGINILDVREKMGKAENNPLLFDGLHPNDEGYDKLAHLIVDYIKERFYE